MILNAIAFINLCASDQIIMVFETVWEMVCLVGKTILGITPVLFSIYRSLFIAITNWITIQYKLLLENVPALNYLFSNIWVFMVVAIILFTIISNTRRTLYP